MSKRVSLALSMVAVAGCVGGGPPPGEEGRAGAARGAVEGAEVWTQLVEINDTACRAAAQHLDCDKGGSCVAGGVIVAGVIPRVGPCTLHFGRDLSVLASVTDKVYLARYDAEGQPLWATTFGDGDTSLHGIALDGERVYAAGGQLTDNEGLWSMAYLRAFDARSGQPMWLKLAGTTGGHRFSAVTVDVHGDIVVAGTIDGSADYGGGLRTVSGGLALVKYDPAGDHIWHLAYSSEPAPGIADAGFRPASVTTTPEGRVHVAGTFSGKASFGDGSALGNNQIFVVAHEPDGGGPAWRRVFGKPSQVPGHGLTGLFGVTALRPLAGDLVLGGTFGDALRFGKTTLTVTGGLTSPWTHDVFVARLRGADGDPRWARAFPGSMTQSLRGLATAKNTVQVAVDFAGTVDFGLGELTAAGAGDGLPTDLAICTLDADGRPRWQRHLFGTPALTGAVSAAGLDLDMLGHGYVFGGFSSSVDFGSGPVTAAATGQYLTKLAP